MVKGKEYTFEIYTRNPITGESGWDIMVGFVTHAKDREDAVRQIKLEFGKLFDCIIDCYQCALFPMGKYVSRNTKFHRGLKNVMFWGNVPYKNGYVDDSNIPTVVG